MANTKIKIDWKSVIVGTIAVIAVALSAGALAKATRLETTKDIGVTSFQIAGVTDTGKLDTSEKGNVTSDLINAEGLKVAVDKEANVKYVVHYYDEDKNYISSSAEQTTDYTAELPEKAKFARVELTPLSDEDGEVTIFEMPGYVALIKVTTNK